MKVVLDTNVWLSAIFWTGEAYKLIEEIEDKKINVIITEEIILEISNVLNKETKFQRFIKNRKLTIVDLIRTIIYMSKLIISKSKLNIIKEHNEDNKILEAGIDGNVDYILSYDNHLLKVKEYKGIKIITPTEFLHLFNY